MEMRRVETASRRAGPEYECRFCGEEVRYRTAQCPRCGIPRPAKEAMGQRLMLVLLGAVVVLGAVGFVAGHLAGSWTFRIVGALVGVVLGFVLSQRAAGTAEVTLRTHAFLRLNPEAIAWPPSAVASQLGTPAVGVVARALGEARRRR
ncbi:MAG: hypothetical protein MUF10_13320 [Thermoanaerobaculaceae bacterium]|jgi:hypothetical protein|nr:hypothetical protein [Thermoanaerobaculaceae bacterium]